MDTAILIIISITLFVILGSIYLEVRRQVKPRIKACFPDGSTHASYRAKEETNVAIHIENSGRFGFPKPVATPVSVYFYAPTSLLLKKLQYSDSSDTDVTKAPSGGTFGGTHYLHLEEAFALFHGEQEVITVLMQMPEDTGNYCVTVAAFSDQGDLGIHKLDIIVY